MDPCRHAQRVDPSRQAITDEAAAVSSVTRTLCSSVRPVPALRPGDLWPRSPSSLCNPVESMVNALSVVLGVRSVSSPSDATNKTPR